MEISFKNPTRKPYIPLFIEIFDYPHFPGVLDFAQSNRLTCRLDGGHWASLIIIASKQIRSHRLESIIFSWAAIDTL